MGRRAHHYRKTGPSDTDLLGNFSNGLKNNSAVKLYCPFLGANNATFAKDYSSSNHTLTFNGNAKISTSQSYYSGEGSLYCDGAGDYVSIPHSSGFNLGTASSLWSLGFKMYVHDWTGVDMNIFTHFYESSPYDGWAVFIANSTKLLKFWLSNGGTSLQSLAAVETGRWYDVLLVCNGSKRFLYLNSILQSAESSSDVLDYSGNCQIGGTILGSQYFKGYISSAFIVKDEAWNTHRFYDATLDAKSAYAKACWKFGEYGIYDCIGSNHLTNNGVTFSDIGLQGRKCATFNGSSAYMNISDNDDLSFNTGILLSYWASFNGTGGSPTGYETAFAKDGGGTCLLINRLGHSTGVVRHSIFQSNGTEKRVDTDASVATGELHHYVLIAENGTVSLYLDGLKQSTTQSYDNTIKDNNATFYIGTDTGSYMSGKIAETLYLKNPSFSSDSEKTAFARALYNSGRAKLLRLETAEHKMRYVPDNDAFFRFHNPTLDLKIPDHVWKFGDYGVRDMVGTKNMTNSGGTFADSGLLGYKVMTLNGSSQYAYYADDDDWDYGTGEFALGGWFNWSSSPSVAEMFTHGGNGGSTDVAGWTLASEGSNRLDFLVYSGPSTLVVNMAATGLTLGTGVWHFVCVTRDADGRIDLWLDGTSVANTTYASTVSYGTSQLRVGTSHESNRYFPGKVQDLFTMKGKSYNASEMALLYASGKARLVEFNPSDRLDSYSNNMVFNSNLDEVSGTRYDTAGFNHLTDNGSADSFEDPDFGRVAHLNGSSQYFSIGGITNGSIFLPSSSNGAKYTVSCWVNLDSLPATNDYMLLIGCGRYTYGKWQIMLRDDSGNKYVEMDFWKSDGNQAWLTFNQASMATGVWYNYVMTADGSNVKGYLDGTYQTPSGGSYSYTAFATEGTNDFRIGASTATSSVGKYVDGKVRKVQIWKDEALSDAAIASIYNSRKGRALNFRQGIMHAYSDGRVVPYYSIEQMKRIA